MMTLSKQFSLLVFLFVFLFPLRHASNPQKCPSSYMESYINNCERLGVPIRFPFCGHTGFNVHCNKLINKTVLELPMSGTFLVETINYSEQQIYISDPEKCLVKRLLTFNTSGSPFSNGFSVNYTFLTCPNEIVIPSWYPTITCLSNSTTSFFATSNLSLANSMLPSCQVVKRLAVPVSVGFKDVLFKERFSGVINYVDLMLEWSSPNCRSCENQFLRCGFKNKASLQVKCFADKSGGLSTRLRVLIITLCIIGGIIIFTTCIVIRIYNSERFVTQRRQNAAFASRTVTQQPREVVVTTGLDQSTIESYKKVELGESRRLPGTNGIICPICLSEYASKEIVRCIPQCDHCFHVECIDAWLKIHGSCPVCRRNSRS